MHECILFWFSSVNTGWGWLLTAQTVLSFVKPWASNPRFIQLCVTVCPLNILVIAPCKYNKSCGVREDLKHISSHQRSSAKWLFSFTCTTQCINIPSCLANKSNFSYLQRCRINRTFISFNRQSLHQFLPCCCQSSVKFSSFVLLHLPEEIPSLTLSNN